MWLDDQGYEIGKDAHNSPRYEHEDQHAGDTTFHIGILPEEVTCIEQEADKEDDP